MFLATEEMGHPVYDDEGYRQTSQRDRQQQPPTSTNKFILNFVHRRIRCRALLEPPPLNRISQSILITSLRTFPCTGDYKTWPAFPRKGYAGVMSRPFY